VGDSLADTVIGRFGGILCGCSDNGTCFGFVGAGARTAAGAVARQLLWLGWRGFEGFWRAIVARRSSSLLLLSFARGLAFARRLTLRLGFLAWLVAADSGAIAIDVVSCCL
jgi:hypothetical protein